MAKSINDKSVPELKHFLSERGIKTSGYRKNELIALAKQANAQGLSPKSKDDYFESSKIRRTVGNVVLPHPSSLSSWTDDLSNLPIIESFDVHIYLREMCQWTNERLKSYKNDNSYRLHTNGHIKDVTLCKVHTNLYYVRGKCVPEERQSADPYDVWVIVLSNGTIHAAECTCVAGDGTCKHVAAFLFGLQRFCVSLAETSEVSATDMKAKWVNPTRTTVPSKITALDLRCKPSGVAPPIKPNQDTYKPIPVYDANNNVEKQVMNLIKMSELPACAAYILSDDSDTEYDFEPLLDNMYDFAKKFKIKNPAVQNLESFIDFMKLNMNEDYINTLCTKTKEQSNCSMWFYQRQGRITASNVFNCCHLTGRSSDSTLVKSILGLKCDLNNNVPALAHGKKI